MSNYRGSGGQGRSRNVYQHDDRTEVADREITFNRGRSNYNNNNYTRGSRANYNSNNRYSALDFGADAFNQQDDMRKYGNKAKSNKRGNSRGSRTLYRPPRGRPGPRAQLDDEDDMMGDVNPGTSGNKRYSPYGGRQRGSGSQNNRGSSQRSGFSSNRGYRGGGSYRGGRDNYRGFSGGTQAWFKVQIPHGAKEPKDVLLRSLLNITEVPFVPREFHTEGNQAIFHIQDSAAATALRACSRRITNSQGLKIIVLVHPSKAPMQHSMNPAILEKLKVCMSSRYDPGTKALNLSSLETDVSLTNEGVVLCFAKLSVAREVLKIINEHIPELESLDLQNNKMANLSMLSDLPNKAPNLTRLNLGKNNLRYETDLQCLATMPLLELCLDGNPLCDRFSNEATYVAAIRKRFPKVLRLDGHDLPPPITFDLDTQTKLPDSKGSFFGSNADVKTLVCQFVQQYFGLYDKGDRQSLLDAYHDQAVFSMMAYKNSAISGYQANLNDYWDNSRNLNRAGSDISRRTKQMKYGRLAVVAHLSQMPATQHDPTSLIIDVIHLSTAMLTFSVQGMFREPDSDADQKRQHIRSFSRLFVTVPQGAGISILNEELTITNATAEQKKAFMTAPEAALPSVSNPAAPAAAAAPTPEQQLQITQQFSTQSGMNLDWSAKCLQENNWDYDTAAKVFTDLKSKGQIPPEAFTKS